MHPSRPLRPTRLGPLAAVLISACGPSRPPAVAPTAHPTVAPLPLAELPVASTSSKRATLKVDAPWAACHRGFAVGQGDARAEVGRLAASCAGVTRMHRVGEPFSGEQAAGGKPQRFGWRAQAGRCYRVYAAGVPAIKNLDLLVEDSVGVVLGQDGNDDGAPVVVDAGAICFTQDDEAIIVVSVGDGAGAFAVEVWSD